MNLYAISALVNVATSLVLGFLIIFENPRNRINQLFVLFAISVVVWSYSYFCWQIAVDPTTALFWVHMLMAGAIFIPFFYFHFIVRFIDRQRSLRWLIWFGYLAAGFFSVMNWTPLYTAYVTPQFGFPFWPIAGPLFAPFLILWVGYAVYPVWLLFKYFRVTDDAKKRTQVNYILVGTAIGYIGGCTNYFLWYSVPIFPYGNITASVYIFFVAYAILKHGLFSIKSITTEFLVFILWLFVFVRLLLSNTTSEQLINGGLLLVLLVVGVLLIRSVDNEVEQKENIQKLAKELEITNEQQEGLLHFIGHEVKGFLTKDSGAFAALLEGDFAPIPEVLKPFVEHALTESRRGVDTVTNLLKASNLKRGTVTYTKEPFDLKALVSESIDRAKPTAKDKGLSINLTTDDSYYQMTGDKAQIGDHILHNLIDNAINYTPSGSIDVSLKKEGAPSTGLGTGKFILSIKDTGIGISEEDKKRLFTEGGHGKDSQKVNVNSTGYGLYIAKQITEAHGGTIRAESAGEGNGSTFIVEFPAI